MNIPVKKSSPKGKTEFKGFSIESGSKDLEDALKIFNQRIKKRFPFLGSPGNIRIEGKVVENSEKEHYKIEFASKDKAIISAASRIGFFSRNLDSRAHVA
jgi:hypothetical protein